MKFFNRGKAGAGGPERAGVPADAAGFRAPKQGLGKDVREVDPDASTVAYYATGKQTPEEIRAQLSAQFKTAGALPGTFDVNEARIAEVLSKIDSARQKSVNNGNGIAQQ